MNEVSDRVIAVDCVPLDGGWRCTVRVGEDEAATQHEVEVDREALADLAPGAEPAALVRASFEFLLEREPRESIMRTFELPIIARFFADYPAEIVRRLASDRPRASSGQQIGS